MRLRRGAARGDYEPDTVKAVLDSGVIAHVGVATDSGPVVIPMAYGRDDEWLYLHGSVANAMLRAAVGHDICVTVTIVDGLLFARTPFHNSMQYRSVVVRGTARRVTEPDEHARVLRIISDHVVANWANARPPTEIEIRKTMAVAVPLAEASAKIRAGDPIDEPDDLAGPYWAGALPITTTFGRPLSAADLPRQVSVPAVVEAAGNSPVHPR